MGLFSSNKSFLGVDIGNSAIKQVELGLSKGRAKLLTYGYVEQDINLAHAESADEQKAAEIIKQVYKKAHVKTRKTIAALPNFSVFSSIISLTGSS